MSEIITEVIISSQNDIGTAFFKSLALIIATEIGDKTFFIAAILAMKHGRLVVYAGAMGALAIMHLLSSFMVIYNNIFQFFYLHF
jgi:putative Ca2+/H+ antiporter (TMEM165/GDT1 family)